MLTIIPEKEFRTDLYRIFEVNFVISSESEITNLFLTSELFWFNVKEDGSTEYENISSLNTEEAEMAKSMFAYLELEKINEIKSKIKSQNWSPGYCDGKPVTTLMNIILNDI